MKKNIYICMLCFLFALAIVCPVRAEGQLSWYCKRNKEHTQPTLDENMRFIEKYDGYYVDKKHGADNTDKVVYLTFDAGYENGNIAKILDAMKAEQVTGAFFILSNLVIKNPELVLRMVNEGHIVANHTSKHRVMTEFNSAEDMALELNKLNELYSSVTGKEMPKYFRPPEGRFDERSMSFIRSLGYKTVFWSIAYADWDNNRQLSTDAAIGKIMDNLHNGAVILLHPTSDTNAAMMQDLIQGIKAQGYRFGTLDELTA